MSKRKTIDDYSGNPYKQYHAADTRGMGEALHQATIDRNVKKYGADTITPPMGQRSSVPEKQETLPQMPNGYSAKTPKKLEPEVNLEPPTTGNPVAKFNDDLEITYVHDGDTFWAKRKGTAEEPWPVRISKVHAPEVANKHSGLPSQPGGQAAKDRLQSTVDNYGILTKNTGESTHKRPVYEVKYTDGIEIMSLDSMMAVDGYSMPSTRFTTPKLEAYKQKNIDGNSDFYQYNWAK